MYNGKTTSLKTVLWKVLNNPLASEITYEQAGEFAIEAIRLIGAPLQYIDRVTPPIQVIEHKAVLPSNYLFIRQVRFMTNSDNYESDTLALTYATDTFHPNFKCVEEGCEDFREMTYTIQGGIITTSFSDGYVQASYKALATDEDGFPMVPDDQDTLLAIEYYILFRFIEPLWIVGKITDKAFEYIVQQKSWYLGAANTSLQIASIDHLEAITSTINRLILNSTAHDSFYKGQGKRERIKKYN